MVSLNLVSESQGVLAPKVLDARMDYQCYWVEGEATPVCNFHGFIKHPSDIPLNYCLDSDPNIADVQMLQVHEGGMVFGSNSIVPIGLDIHIRIGIQGCETVLHGLVTHCFQVADGQYDIGVQFKEDNQHHAMRMIEQASHIEHYRKTCLNRGRMLSEDEAALEWIERYAEIFPR